MTITVRKLPWWQWALVCLWLLLEVIVVQTALASAAEEEYRAAVISWIAAAVLTAIGIVAYLRGRSGRVEQP